MIIRHDRTSIASTSKRSLPSEYQLTRHPSRGPIVVMNGQNDRTRGNFKDVRMNKAKVKRVQGGVRPGTTVTTIRKRAAGAS